MSNEIRYYTDGTQATAANLNKPLQDLNKQGQYMSKAEFESLAEMRRNTFAGSGFVEWGRVYGNDVINEGMWTDASPQLESRNLLLMGRNKGTGTGPDYPIVNLEGSLLKLKNISRADFADDGLTNKIHFPEAPTSLGTITDSTSLGFDMKQGDFAILNDSTDRELSKNTHFDDDIFLVPNNASGEVTTENSLVRVTNDGFNADKRFSVSIGEVVEGMNYEVTLSGLDYSNSTTGQMCFIGRFESTSNTNALTTTRLENGTTKFTASYSGKAYFVLGLYYNANDNDYVELDYVSVKCLSQIEQPIIAIKDVVSGTDIFDSNASFEARDSISRQDLIFLETWHENVVDKDIVYPYGNIQYRGGNTDSLSNIGEGTFAGKETYSLFGNWQSENDLVGLGYKWSDLSNEDKLKFAGNKNNNIYKDGDNIIQVRYRVRVIKGLGSKWATPMRSFYSDPYYDGNGGYHTNWIGVKGNKTSVPDLISGDPGACFRPLMISDGNVSNTRESIGVFGGCCRHNPNTFALPLALVQRRNDGAFDPVYNPEGSGTFTDGKEWYETSDSHSSITDCFNNKANGYIGTVSGRPDRLFADEINPVDVEDLRMSAQRKPIVDIFEEQTRLLAGNSSYIIGRENTKITKKVGSFVKASSFEYLITNHTSIEVEVETQLEYNKIEVGKSMIITFIGDNGNMISFRRIQDYYIEHIYVPYTTLHRAYFYGFGTQERVDKLNSLFPNGTKIDVLIDIDSSYTMNKEVMYSNIIGDPRKLSDRVKYTVVDGTSQTVNLLKNDYVLNDDGHIYRALVSRDSIDLDTDDYTNTSNWIDLGTDGSIGGYPEEWLDDGIYGSAAITKQDLTSNLPIDNEITTGFNAYFIRKYNSTKGYLLARKKDGTFIVMNGDNINIASTAHNAQYNKSEYRFDYSALGYNSMGELRDLCIVIEYQYTNTNVLENDIENNYIYMKKEFNGGNSFYKERGAAIMEDMIKGVITGYSTEKHSFNGYLDVSEETDSKSFYIYAGNDSIPKHTLNPIPTDLGNTYSRTVKYFSFVTKTNGKICINYIFKEIRYDNETGTWGDDSLFHTVGHDGIDYVGTILDDNGLEVMHGEKSFTTPYFIEINKI